MPPSAVLARFRSLWRNLARRGRVEADLDAELRAYIDLAVDEKRRNGMSETPARRASLGVAAVLTGVVRLATYVPSRRALRIDPLTAMRSS